MPEYIRTPTVTKHGRLTRRRRSRSPLRRLNQIVPRLRTFGG